MQPGGNLFKARTEEDDSRKPRRKVTGEAQKPRERKTY